MINYDQNNFNNAKKQIVQQRVPIWRLISGVLNRWLKWF